MRDYLASGVFREKRPSTQAEYRRVLEALAEVHGPKPIRQLERRHIRRIRDERADTPGAANTIVRMLKLLLNFAVEDGLIAANPAAKMKLLKVGEWRAWTDEECAAFEADWPVGSMERRAYRLAIFTGQRKGDLVLMTRAHRKDGAIRVVQGKTGEDLWIPEHRELTAELVDRRAHEPAHHVAGQGVRSGLFWRVVCRRDRQGGAGRRLRAARLA